MQGLRKNNEAFIPRLRLFAYGQMGMPLAAISLPLYVYLPTFYAETLGLGLATVGLILLIARIWDLLTDPLVGVLSDRVGKKYRRKKWITAGCPVFLVGLILLFVPFKSVGPTYLLFVSLFFYLGVTIVMIPYLAWGAELAKGYHDRSRVTGIRECFVIIGTLLAASVPAIVGNDLRSAMQLLAISISLIFIPSAIVLIIVTEDHNVTKLRKWNLRNSINTIFHNISFRKLLLAYFLNGFANGLPATLFILFVSHKLGAPNAVGYLLLTYFAFGIVGIPVWLALSRRIDKHRAWSTAMILACICFLAVQFLRKGDVNEFALICALTGLCLGADLSLPPSIQADIIAKDHKHTGEDRAGAFFGLWNLATKLALALGVGVAFPLLEWSGFNEKAINQPEVAITMLTILYGGLPILLKVGAIVLVWQYGTQKMR